MQLIESHRRRVLSFVVLKLGDARARWQTMARISYSRESIESAPPPRDIWVNEEAVVTTCRTNEITSRLALVTRLRGIIHVLTFDLI